MYALYCGNIEMLVLAGGGDVGVYGGGKLVTQFKRLVLSTYCV